MTDIRLKQAELPVEDQAYYRLVGVSSALTSRASARLEEEFRLPASWFEVLLWLYHQDGPLSATDLGSCALISRSQVSRVIDALQARELVTRAPSASDARSVEVTITPQGRDLFERADAARRETLSPVLADRLDPAELEELARILLKLKG
ncbi:MULTISPECIES: MarR family winged helix-turn-helix transcriptional regulator [Streptomyces]|uniref:MarR family winged helix-turn-helix transcriptional regulator n=1 Tax=Streptomyces TaxID=1883 RepID=UPI000BB145A4|nr:MULTISPECIES: MarR family transcriptional regulator [Streptomyces]MCX4430871.1 MarR family transcriptional regulator [Streptomyces mirabilis]PBD01835.1 MarR family 2-MHQ and catechol resistance regulon transcriptional repressor [Streptomyces sp. Ag82_O1-15]SOE79334.1 MarR family transcriptional regulator, 2-MHQ and catechol-resistance regulon repressor [Streptomyces sp. OV198]